MAAKQYASTTTVNVDKSQADVRAMLKTLGAERMAVFSAPEGDSVVFEVRGTYYKITAPPAKGVQAERSAWRALVLLVKAKKVAIDQNITTLEREFFADVVLRDGSSLIEHRDSLISANYREGPPRLGFEKAGAPT